MHLQTLKNFKLIPLRECIKVQLICKAGLVKPSKDHSTYYCFISENRLVIKLYFYNNYLKIKTTIGMGSVSISYSQKLRYARNNP